MGYRCAGNPQEEEEEREHFGTFARTVGGKLLHKLLRRTAPRDVAPNGRATANSLRGGGPPLIPATVMRFQLKGRKNTGNTRGLPYDKNVFSRVSDFGDSESQWIRLADKSER